MTDSGTVFLMIALFGALFGAAYGWFSSKSKKLREDEHNSALRKELEEAKRAQELERVNSSRRIAEARR